MSRLHRENHLVERIGWLRAAVLGANDGIISTASLILGVASAAASRNDILLTGVAGLVAGAMEANAGVYIGFGRRGTPPAKRVLGDGEPDSQKPDQRAIAARGSGANQSGRDWWASWQESSGGGGSDRSTRDHSWLAP